MDSVLHEGSNQTTIPFASLSSPWLSTKQPGLLETDPRKEEASAKAFCSRGNEDYVNNQILTQYNHPLACSSNPFAESYFGSVIATYGPNAVVYPNVMGITPARVVLPLDYMEGIPIYVNAKQYNAILRRRQIRAKLEVHNKIAKSRKPYLHESRHLHAVKRARGSGGRFLNTKKTQEAKCSTQIYSNSLSLQHISEPRAIHPSESNSWVNSTPSGSEGSGIFNSDDVFQQHDFRGSVSSFPAVHNGAPGNGFVLSVDRCARISTAM